jgi:hypothetical protein
MDWESNHDVMGNNSGGGGAGGPKATAAQPGKMAEYNAYDETYDLHQWTTGPLSMKVPLPDEPVTCEDVCALKHKRADEKCSVARRRIELGLQKAGCPSKVLALRRKNLCPMAPAKKGPLAKKPTKTAGFDWASFLLK